MKTLELIKQKFKGLNYKIITVLVIIFVCIALFFFENVYRSKVNSQLIINLVLILTGLMIYLIMGNLIGTKIRKRKIIIMLIVGFLFLILNSFLYPYIYWPLRAKYTDFKIPFNSDISTLQILHEGRIDEENIHNSGTIIVRDKHYIWEYDLDDKEFNQLQQVDVETYEIFSEYCGDHDNDCYSRDSNNIYYYWDSNIYGVDLESFGVLSSRYAKDANNIYSYSSELEDADVQTFEVLNSDFAKDKDNVYYSSRKIDFNPETTEAVGDHYIKDKTRVHNDGGNMFEADTATFEVIEYPYSKDKDNIYVFGEELSKADVNTFEVLDSIYSKDKTYVYRYRQILNGLDKSSLEILNEDFLKDKNNIYFKDYRFLGVDPNKFKLVEDTFIVSDSVIYKVDEEDILRTIPNGEVKKYLDKDDAPLDFIDYDIEKLKIDTSELGDGSFRIISPSLIKTKNGIFRINSLQIEQTPYHSNSFEFLDGSYVRDKYNLYFDGRQVSFFDPDNFNDLGYGYITDDQYVYYDQKRNLDIDVSSFHIINHNFSLDAQNVYYQGSKIVNSDPLTFKIVRGLFAIDKNYIYSYDQGQTLSKVNSFVDYDTFESITGFYYYKDKNNLYYVRNHRELLVVEDANLAELEVINDSIVRDKRYVYSHGMVVEEADPDTFEIIESDPKYARDKNNIYIRIEYEKSFELLKGADVETFEIVVSRLLSSGPTFAKDKNRIYYDGVPLLEIDISSFEIINSNIQKDRTSIYFKGIRVEGVDSETFQLIDDEDIGIYLGKDKNGMYIASYESGFKKIIGADLNTFEALHSENSFSKLYRDKSNLYIQIHDETKGILIKQIKGFNPDFLEYVGNNYLKDDKNIYDYKTGELISIFDSSSFELLNDQITKDRNHVYYQGEIIEDADSPSYILFGDSGYAKDKNYVFSGFNWITKYDQFDTSTFYAFNDVYTKDKDSVYAYREVLPDADIESFKLVEDSELAKDKNFVYHKKRQILDADPSTFEFITEGNYAIDSDTVFNRYGEKYEKADPSTFEYIKYDYYKDKSRVYNSVDEIEGADPDSFVVIDDEFSKDKSHIYHRSEMLLDADIETFEIIKYSYSYAKDKDNIYRLGSRLNPEGEPVSLYAYDDIYYLSSSTVYFEDVTLEGADPTSFQYVGGNYYRDAQTVYYEGKVVNDADSKTFEFLNGYGMDKNNIYNETTDIGSRDKFNVYHTRDQWGQTIGEAFNDERAVEDNETVE